MLKLIFDFLKSNASITQVIPRGSQVANSDRPYLVIWEDTASLNAMDNGMTGFYVACHVPPDDFALLDNFIVGELFDILDGKILTGEDYQFSVYVTGEISPVVPPKGNDDGTLSRDRLLLIPTRWR